MALNALGLSKTYAQLGRVHPQVVTAVSGPLSRLLQRGFDSGTDPYGRGWAPLTAGSLRRGRTPPPLTRTRVLRASAILIPLPSGLSKPAGPRYGRYHMSGTRHMAKRRYFPDSGLPAPWLVVIRDEYSKRLREHFR